MTPMPIQSGLYVPTCTDEEGRSQPLATALWLDAGKHLCHQHFLKRCRAAMQAPGGIVAGIPPALAENITLEWREAAAGGFEGQPRNCDAAPIASMAATRYKLLPAE